jgi:hypothetical protein
MTNEGVGCAASTVLARYSFDTIATKAYTPSEDFATELRLIREIFVQKD